MLQLYRILAYLGLASIFGAVLVGFRHDPSAPHYYYAINVLLYVAYIGPHLIMTRSWFKRAVWGQPGGSPAERRVYIIVASVLWLVVYAIQYYWLPVPGPAIQHIPGWAQFVGVLAMILSMRSFFEGSTVDMLDGLFGMPGVAMSHSHGAETPLMIDGPYARVRHPHYRAAILACASSLLIHPNAAQLLWAGMIALTFVLFIPIEEAQLIAARGEAYRAYQRQTRYRLFRHVW